MIAFPITEHTYGTITLTHMSIANHTRVNHRAVPTITAASCIDALKLTRFQPESDVV